MKRLRNKIKSRSGETLVESMAAILIFTLSSIILLSMVAVSAKTNYTVRTMDKTLADELSIAEAQSSAESGTQTAEKSIVVKYGTETASINVNTYDSGSNTLRSFAYKK